MGWNRLMQPPPLPRDQTLYTNGPLRVITTMSVRRRSPFSLSSSFFISCGCYDEWPFGRVSLDKVKPHSTGLASKCTFFSLGRTKLGPPSLGEIRNAIGRHGDRPPTQLRWIAHLFLSILSIKKIFFDFHRLFSIVQDIDWFLFLLFLLLQTAEDVPVVRWASVKGDLAEAAASVAAATAAWRRTRWPTRSRATTRWPAWPPASTPPRRSWSPSINSIRGSFSPDRCGHWFLLLLLLLLSRLLADSRLGPFEVLGMKYGGLLCNGPINVTREEIDGSIEGKEGKKKINWRKRGGRRVCSWDSILNRTSSSSSLSSLGGSSPGNQKSSAINELGGFGGEKLAVVESSEERRCRRKRTAGADRSSTARWLWLGWISLSVLFDL